MPNLINYHLPVIKLENVSYYIKHRLKISFTYTHTYSFTHTQNSCLFTLK